MYGLDIILVLPLKEDMSSPDDGDDAGDPIKVGDAGLYGEYISINTVAVTWADIPLLETEVMENPGIESTGRQSWELNLRCLTAIWPDPPLVCCIENKEPQEWARYNGLSFFGWFNLSGLDGIRQCIVVFNGADLLGISDLWSRIMELLKFLSFLGLFCNGGRCDFSGRCSLWYSTDKFLIYSSSSTESASSDIPLITGANEDPFIWPNCSLAARLPI